MTVQLSSEAIAELSLLKARLERGIVHRPLPETPAIEELIEAGLVVRVTRPDQNHSQKYIVGYELTDAGSDYQSDDSNF
ncbi:hypothetical protein ACFL1S_00990 [Pseudomonadota bacterium]